MVSLDSPYITSLDSPYIDFLLGSNSNHMSISHHLAVIITQNLLSLRSNLGPPHPSLPQGDISQNLIASSPDEIEGSHQNEVDWLNTF